MEYCPGVKIKSIGELDKLGVDRKQLAMFGVESYLQKILTYGFFHEEFCAGELLDPAWHQYVLDSLFRRICRKAHMLWVEAIIGSGTASAAVLEAAATRYEGSNYHKFVYKLRDGACVAHGPGHDQLTTKRGQQLLSIFCQGPAAIKLAVIQQSISQAEVERMLEVWPESAASLTARSLRRRTADIDDDFWVRDLY